MPTLDIFNNDAFSLSELTQTITDIPRIPTQIGDEGLFTEYGISKTSMMIERKGSQIQLLPTAPRGGVPETMGRSPGKLIPIAAVHIPVTDSVLADEVQNIRAFGSETEVQSVQALVRERATAMKQSMDLTHEWHRMGAIKGQVLDADGSVLWDMYSIFGFTQQTIFFDLGNANSDMKAKTVALKRAVKAKLGGRVAGGVKVKVSPEWFDLYTGHPTMKKAWELWQNGAYLRQDQSEGDFEFMGVTFQINDYTIGNTPMIAATEGYAYPTGVARMFQMAFAPADFMETVNTNGLPYYLKQDRMKWDKGVELYAQSNPIALNTLPEAVIRVSSAGS